jgi:acyl-coenzyme A synthetase/AMP-(fatty) acid ligase
MGLARGYFNRPELTAERFLPHPFGEEPGARLYKTGDLARFLPDGSVECLGRIDRMVKIRGFRVELGEIEAVLEQHPLILQSLVTVFKDPRGTKRLAAYVITPPAYAQGEQSAHLQQDIFQFLQRKLPGYMRPAVFMILNSFPLSPSGKIDLRALPAPDFPAQRVRYSEGKK